MWGKLHRELIVITIISVLILAVSFAFNFSASQKDILERQTYDYLLDAAHHTKVILHTEIQRQNELLDIVLRNAPRYEGQKDNLINLLSTVSNTGHFSTVGLTYRGQKTLMSNGEEIDILDQDYYKRALEGEEVVEGPVRYVGNRSSGKMGYAIAQAAADRGAEVTLVSGPSVLNPPANVKTVQVETTQQMMDACLAAYNDMDIVIKAAAVADYRPHDVAEQKIKKKTDDALTVVMDKNPDILKALGERKEKQFLVGFAAETQNLIANAKEKICKKNLDMIVANDVTLQGAGFNSDTNIVKFLFPVLCVKSLESARFSILLAPWQIQLLPVCSFWEFTKKSW